MKLVHAAVVAVALVAVAGPSAAQKMVGKCMRPDCAAMQAYCEESKAAGKTGTNCAAAGKKCVAGGGKSWTGTQPDGKAWACTF